jgi:hypothetical protein
MPLPWPPRLDQWREQIDAAAEATGLAPELIAAVVDRESGGGDFLTPRGPSGTGDAGHGRGLCQIDDRFHADWLANNDWRDAAVNIMFGAKLLKGYVDMLGGIPAGIAAYNAGPSRAQRILDNFGMDVSALDTITTGRDYVSDVLARVEQLQTLELEG